MNKFIKVTLCTSALLITACAREAVVDNKKQEGEQKIAVAQTMEHRGAKKTIVQEDKRERKIKKLVSKSSADHAMQSSSIASSHNMRIPNSYYSPYPITPPPSVDGEKYQSIIENSVNQVSEKPVSTFSIDVDTASYSNIRRILNQGNIPQYDAVRVEELINYFSYDYPRNSNHAEQPFSVYTEVAPSPFNADKQLVHIGIQGKNIEKSQRPEANLVFLLDVSGSMNSANKLGLLKNSLKMLIKQLSQRDSVAIVVYAGAAGVVLEPTAGDNHHAIISALAKLSAGGSTNGGQGIQVAYDLAEQAFVKKGINRVILATDGDFNVGTVNQQALKNLIELKRKSGIALSVLGFGMGNYNDSLMQELAQNGNGNAYYIDTLNEARKVLVEELSSTLMIIAKDVKIQLEFNPNLVSEYRLIGYETRALKREDFNNDKVDAGEIGAGHSVTALYEVSFVGAQNKSFDELRYQSSKQSQKKRQFENDKNQELAFLRLRYKLPKEDESQLIESPIMQNAIKASLSTSSNNFRFSAAVAGFGQLLRGGKNLTTLSIEQIITLAQNAKGADKYGYKAEFINMVKLSDALAINSLPQQTNENLARTKPAINLLKGIR